MKTVTFDSTSKPNDTVVTAAADAGWNVAYTSVTKREAQGADFHVELVKFKSVAELGVWDESGWDKARWADEASSNALNDILNIISNGSFPKRRDILTNGQLHQLRDAMILEAHANAKRDVFVTGDIRAFIKNSNREQLQKLLNTQIYSTDEFEAELHAQATSV